LWPATPQRACVREVQRNVEPYGDAFSASASYRSSVEALTRTSADTRSTGALSGGSSLGAIRSFFPCRIEFPQCAGRGKIKADFRSPLSGSSCSYSRFTNSLNLRYKDPHKNYSITANYTKEIIYNR